MDTIICPYCKKKVELTDAIIHELSEKVRAEEKVRTKIELEKARVQERALSEKRLRQEFQAENKEKQKELEEIRKRGEILERRLKVSEEESRKREGKIKEQTLREAQQASRLEKLELEKKLRDTQKALDEAQRKAKQGSGQLQGEVLELDLEEGLRKAFPLDTLKPVPKGIRGGDVIQEIKNKYGNVAGSILWEAKRQKAWNRAWPMKLKDDMRKVNASDCILITDILPPDIKVYDRIDNVWVTSYEYAIKLASVLRLGLLNVAIARSSASHGDEKLREFYAIVTSDQFRHMFEARGEMSQPHPIRSRVCQAWPARAQVPTSPCP